MQLRTEQTSFVLIAAVMVFAACSGAPTQAPDAVSEADASSAGDAMATSRAAVETVTGVVTETMDASSYTYVQIDTGDGSMWAAAPQFDVAVGDRVVVPLEMPMENFHSDALGRDFDVVYFASRIGREGEAPVPVGIPAGHPQLGVSEASVETGAVEPADGGLTIAQVWQRREGLAGKPVAVRGEVVKFNGGILGTNWVHLQDGTGSTEDGTHDLTVTTDASVRVGDVVTATGTVAIDRDFGSGYRYDVIVEKAAIDTD